MLGHGEGCSLAGIGDRAPKAMSSTLLGPILSQGDAQLNSCHVGLAWDLQG